MTLDLKVLSDEDREAVQRARAIAGDIGITLMHTIRTAVGDGNLSPLKKAETMALRSRWEDLAEVICEFALED